MSIPTANLIDGITKWVHGWKKRGWVNASKKPVRNAELWHDLIALTARHKVDWHWVKGHSGHPENERVDRLASDEADRIAARVDQLVDGFGFGAVLHRRDSSALAWDLYSLRSRRSVRNCT